MVLFLSVGGYSQPFPPFDSHCTGVQRVFFQDWFFTVLQYRQFTVIEYSVFCCFSSSGSPSLVAATWEFLPAHSVKFHTTSNDY